MSARMDRSNTEREHGGRIYGTGRTTSKTGNLPSRKGTGFTDDSQTQGEGRVIAITSPRRSFASDPSTSI